MDEEIRKGFYKDKYGRVVPDRRSGIDRRATGKAGDKDHERRRVFRRKADRELFERDHRTMINEALQDFAEEHQGRL